MNKLTAEKCREMFLNLFDDKRQDGITMKEDLYMQALEIALPILEQQERGEGDRRSVRDEKVSFELLPGESEYDRLNRMYQWMKVKPAHGMSLADRGDSEWIEWGGGDCPVGNMVTIEPKLRNGRVMSPRAGHSWNWVHRHLGYDIIAYRVVKP